MTLSDPTFYYETENSRKHQVELPLTPTIMSQMPDPKYRQTDDVTFALFSVFYKAQLNYANVISNNNNNNHTNNNTNTQTINEEFIYNTTKLLQRLQDVAEARQRKGPERTLERMTQIISDYAKESATSSRKRRLHEPYIPKPKTNIEVIDIDLYTPTPCPVKRTRMDNDSGPIYRSRMSIKDRLGPKPYHL